MKLGNLKNEEIKRISRHLSSQLRKQPLFMFLCPNREERRDFIEAYFNYKIFHFSKYDALLCAEDDSALVSLEDPRHFTFKYKGWGAKKMKRFETASNVFFYKEAVEYIVRLVAPRQAKIKIMSVYSRFSNIAVTEKLIDKAIKLSKINDFVLIFETIDERYIPLMEQKGFETAYQKPFMDTRFLQTVMIYET